MKRLMLTSAIFGFLTTQACSTRSDKVFSAFDELHYIILYEQGNEFEILYNGLNTATGTYLLENDTIHLTYTQNQFAEFNSNEKLTRKILIDKKSKRVKSLDDKMQFCANVELDKRNIVDHRR